MTGILWHSAELRSSEYFTHEPTDGGHRLRGVVVLPIAGRPAHIGYTVEVDAAWLTRRVDVRVEQPGGSTDIHIEADGQGCWERDGEPAPELSGCLDVDLGWTPATNTLQIRRLGLEVGEERTLDVAWMRFPELTLEAVAQTYRRLGQTAWRYSAGDFDAVLEVDDHGFVRRYGEDIWTAIAAT
ncbi:MAG TPA: putative glycolipid-binding domain-containing protein [Actinomycetes bacterium]|jgi:hypothetical protein|nr:putative glycolipid-binding domain-containing protein [Actinomycetes bacterium]